MNGEYCYFCKKPMGNSLNTTEIMLNGIRTEINCHVHCQREQEEQK